MVPVPSHCCSCLRGLDDWFHCCPCLQGSGTPPSPIGGRNPAEGRTNKGSLAGARSNHSRPSQEVRRAAEANGASQRASGNPQPSVRVNIPSPDSAPPQPGHMGTSVNAAPLRPDHGNVFELQGPTLRWWLGYHLSPHAWTLVVGSWRTSLPRGPWLRQGLGLDKKLTPPVALARRKGPLMLLSPFLRGMLLLPCGARFDGMTALTFASSPFCVR